jgi:AcrR family transcriptional regulator
MPRALGQIDTRKHDAILDAAVEVLAERGIHAPIEEVARRAGVSKQTVYNHYGSKTDLVRTIIERRRNSLTAMLEQAPPDDDAQVTLTAYARSILEAVSVPTSVSLLRMGIAGANDMPDLAETIYQAGQKAARLRLANYFESRNGRNLKIADPVRAAEVFSAIVIGSIQMRLLLGLPAEIEPGNIGARAEESARLFLRAYADPASTPAL